MDLPSGIEPAAPALAMAHDRLAAHAADTTFGSPGQSNGWAEIELDGTDVVVQPFGVRCSISWTGDVPPRGDRVITEASVQALAGLMHGHRSDQGRPRRIGLDIASAAAALLGTQGVLASLFDRLRGSPARSVETSVLSGGVLLMAHYIANATCDDPDFSPIQRADGNGPPFLTADGVWAELETLDADSWITFWSALDAPHNDIASAWIAFRRRYSSGECTLPTSLHDAVARVSMRRVTDLADRARVSVVAVRSAAEAAAELPRLPSGMPTVIPIADASDVGQHRERARPGSIIDSRARRKLPLEGVIVVESTNRFQGPLAGLLLRMLGATVTKVEPPGGDPYRLMPPATPNGGATFLCFNRGKASIELDLSKPQERAALKELLRHADVFLHNWRPGKAHEWRLDGDALARVNPRVIYAHASGWNEDLAREGLLGTDFIVQARVGLGSSLNPSDEVGLPSRMTLTDYLGALVTCEGILAALVAREIHGSAYNVNGSLLAGAMTAQSPTLRHPDLRDEPIRRSGLDGEWGPLDQPVSARKGWVSMTIRDQLDLSRAARAVGLRDTADATSITRAVRAQDADTVVAALAEHGVPSAVVCTDLESFARHGRFDPILDGLPDGIVVPAAPWRLEASTQRDVD